MSITVRRHGVDLLGRDSLVLGRMLATLGSFSQAAAASPAAPALAAATLELLKAPQARLATVRMLFDV